MTPHSSLTGEAEAPALQRRDLLACEQILRDDMARVLPFEAHSLYFPMTDEVPAPVWIAEENKLLLPLRHGEVLLGVMLLRELDATAVESLLPFLPGIASLCLDKLALYKNSRTDSLTGLATRDVLLERLEREVGSVRRAFASSLGWDGEAEGSAPFQASLGLAVFRLTGLREASRVHGHTLAEKLMKASGAALLAALPDEALAARTGDSEFAVFLPGAVRQSAENTVRELLRALEGVRLSGPLTGTPVRAAIRSGYALFPQDWTGNGRSEDGNGEEAASLVDKARLAALRTVDLGGHGDSVLGYGAILPKGGVIDQVLPLSRVRTTLGRDVGAREGQRFSVWSLDYPVQGRGGAGTDATDAREPLYKGEIVLADVREDSSQADVLLLGDPAWPLAPGDRLALLPEDYGAHSTDDLDGDRARADGRPDPLTGLCRHGDFLARLAVAREKYPSFGLALFRFELPLLDAEGRPLSLEHAMGEAAACLRRLMVEMTPKDSENTEAQALDLFAGRYSLNSILLFHPGLSAEAACEMYPVVGAALRDELDVPVAVGVACLPWLSYRAADGVECCRKALEYGLLLPEPHVGVFNSLAINISADKRYSQGDVFGAMEEYRLALLADENNTLAWNSLGVSLAGLGRHAEARRSFEEAVGRGPDEPAAHYNLGTACVTLGDVEAATEQFLACLKLAPNHLYAHIRLGELAEAHQDGEHARKHYEDAQKADSASPQPHRCLARLEFREGRPDKARERLHQALLRHPHDPFSLHLLARLYLDGGEDVELAETLARQSVALRPDRKAAWLELARALEAQGRLREAQEARVKALGLCKAQP